MFIMALIYNAYQMEITKEDTFEAVIRLIKEGHNPVALDFASGTNPGGGWRSGQQGTQEESLCKRSNLGLLLEKKKYPMPRDGAYYIPNVIISKDKNGNEINKVKCSIIASELRGIASCKSDYLQKRICSIYDLSIRHGHDVVVLGAWGCGAFKETDDDVKILCEEYLKALKKYDGKIKSIFAILTKANYEKFIKYLGKT